MGTTIVGLGGSRDTNVPGGALAKGNNSHAEGEFTVASGNDGAHAEGNYTTASGVAAHAEGGSTTASSTNAHAEGGSTQATNTNAHAEGLSTQATGQNSHAEGQSTIANGTNAHAEGQSCQANGQNAHAEGEQSSAPGYASHAEGMYAVASRYAQRARSSTRFISAGDAQQNVMTFALTSSGNVAAVLTADKAAVALTPTAFANVYTLIADRAHRFQLDVVARRSDVSGDAAGWEFTGLIVRDASGSAAFAGSVQAQAWGTTGAAAWDCTVTIDTTDATNNYLKITVTGGSGQTVRWFATLTAVEVG